RSWVTTFTAYAQGPRGVSASAYQTSPRYDVWPTASTAIITHRRRNAFQYTDPPWAFTLLPLCLSRRCRSASSARRCLPAISFACSAGPTAGVFRFHEERTFPSESRSIFETL